MATVNAVRFDLLMRDRRHLGSRAAVDLVDWLAYLELEGKAARTRDDYERTAAALVNLVDKDLGDYDDADLMHFLRLVPEGSRQTKRAHLNSLFSWAYRMSKIDRNPMERVPRPRRQGYRVPGIFTDEEVALLETLPSPDGPLYAILLGTGLRKSEARKLQRSMISLTTNELVVYSGKGDKDRVVPLPRRAAAAVADLDLLERLNPEDYLWYSRPGGGKVDRSRPIGETSFQRWHKRCIEAAGVRYLKPHATRHTYATYWRRAGLDLDELQLLLGHTSIRTTSDLYVHTTVSDVARKIAAIEAGL